MYIFESSRSLRRKLVAVGPNRPVASIQRAVVIGRSVQELTILVTLFLLSYEYRVGCLEAAALTTSMVCLFWWLCSSTLVARG